MFENVDLDDLWYEGDDSDKEYYYDKEEYECDNNVSDDLIKSIENDLGFKLPQSYIFLKRNYKCWYDEIEEIKEENGIKEYILKNTDRKMFFIISKKEKINIGDKFLCTTDGYAFKYDPFDLGGGAQ